MIIGTMLPTTTTTTRRIRATILPSILLITTFTTGVLAQNPAKDPFATGGTSTTTTNGNGNAGATTPYSCWLLDDVITQCTAIQHWHFDKQCNANAGADTGNVCDTDCFDCDPCHEHHYDCASCMANNCVWCPGEAYCSSKPLTNAVWDRMAAVWGTTTPLLPACSTADDWQSTCDQAPLSSMNDPLYSSMQWVYDMINITSVWTTLGLRGQGIHVRVNDVYGVDGNHEEFAGRFDREHSCAQFLPPRLNGTDPSGGGPFDFWTIGPLENHGTAVASLAVGGGDNNVCAVGIAPEATLSACTFPNISNSFERYHLLKAHMDVVDITVNAWSDDACVRKQAAARQRRQLRTETLLEKLQQQQQQQSSAASEQDRTFQDERNLQHRHLQTCPFDANVPGSPCTRTNVCNFASPNLGTDCEQVIANYCILQFEADIDACTDHLDLYADCNYVSYLEFNDLLGLEEGIYNGRQGKGVIHVFASGNLFASGDSVTSQKWTNSRYTLTVGAVGKDGLHASYSNPGPALWVAAPGGDRAHVTNNVVALLGGGCSDVTYGTSFAAPVVAGIVALLLQARPELTWRDVQGIFATTSQQVSGDPKAENDPDFWTTNAAGFRHSYFYGFGLVDASAAVELAKTWELFPTEQILWATSPDGINVTIPDDPSQSADFVLTMPEETTEYFVESAVVSLQVDHPSRGDLVITLTSPSGTVSELHPEPRPENTHLRPDQYWQFLTVRSWGETPAGEWKLSVSDQRQGNINDNCVDLPWSYFLQAQTGAPYGASVTCSGIERAAALQCVNGAINDPNIDTLMDPVSGLSPGGACCVCGGGVPPTKNRHVVSWKIELYGHDLPGGIGVTSLFPPTDPPPPPQGMTVDEGSVGALPGILGGNASAEEIGDNGGDDQETEGGESAARETMKAPWKTFVVLAVAMIWL